MTPLHGERKDLNIGRMNNQPFARLPKKDIATGLANPNTLDIGYRMDGVIGKLWDGEEASSLRIPCNRVVI